MSVEVRSRLTTIRQIYLRNLSKENIKFTIPRISLLVLCFSAFVLCFHATIGNVWISNTRYYASAGLWKYCLGSTCWRMDVHQPYWKEICTKCVNHNWINVCRVCIILGCFLTFAGLISSILTIINKNVHGYIASIFMLLASLLIAVCVTLYDTQLDWENMRIECGPNYFTAWLSTVCSATAGFFGFCTF